MKLRNLENKKYIVPTTKDKIATEVIAKKKTISESVSWKLAIFIILWTIVQLYITPLFGIEQMSEQWNEIFILDSENPLLYWTYVTSIFSHGSLFHLFINIFVFLSFARLIEYEMSTIEYLSFLFITGILAGVIQIWIASQFISESIQLVGFSGAVSGVIGYATARFNIPIYLLFIFEMKIKKAIGLYVAVSVAIIVVFGFGAFRIAHTAHIAGIFIGFIYGLYKNRTIEKLFESRFSKL